MKGKLTAAIAALVLAGCGVDDEPEPKSMASGTEREAPGEPTRERPNTARFIEKADVICAVFNDWWVGVPEATPEYYRDWEESNAGLEALDAPAGISTEWSRFLAALERQLRFSRAENGVELKQAYERKEKAAQGIGLADCASR